MRGHTQVARIITGLFLFGSLVFPFSANVYAEVSIVNMNFASGTFTYNPRTLKWTAVSSSGKLVRTGHGSSGRAYCPDIHRSCRTPSGTYHVIGKRGADCKSSRYPVGRGGAPMPYCMYFSKLYAVHGSYDVPNYNASHGCIRVPPSDAQWLYNNFMSLGTKVVVKPY
ncbi:MAG: L,D-transpeptidase [Legionellaceae bacterium]|nr:L,D-transpeptidase [Legionellaceae bacterium]